ncbi:VOC family protein [Streptomyces sp. NPDC007205]|uniref:VOC family protein n=1 Tax=Streptomyces sp. NPDC007205 TaxID=3154316 RepID=UPI0033E6F92E
MTVTGTNTPALAGQVACQAVWAPDGRALADFYAAALGTEVSEIYPDQDGNETAFAFSTGETRYVFYTSASFTAPDWPKGELPFHIDLAYDDVTAAEQRLLELGAAKPVHQPGGRRWTVLLDPSGQPFCIHPTH